MSHREPLALRAYEELAEAYAANINHKPHNAYYDRPAVLSLLPELDTKVVLDAGCGPGAYAQVLGALGGRVFSFDISPKMLGYARQRLGPGANLFRADLGFTLPLPREAFDVIVCPLVLDYLPELLPVFKEYYRLLRPGGVLVFSQGHPFADFTYFGSQDYFATEQVGSEWRGFGIPVYVPTYRRPLSAIINPLLEAGFILQRLLEPLPTEQFRQADPEGYAELVRRPGFICLRAVK